MKRNLKTNYNIEKVCDVNQVSRQLVTGEISLQEAFDELNRLKVKELPYNNKQLIAAATLSAPFFSIMFGGNFYDALGAAIATFFGFAFSLYVDKYIRIPFVTAFAGAFVFGLLAHVWTRYSGFNSTDDLIIAPSLPLHIRHSGTRWSRLRFLYVGASQIQRHQRLRRTIQIRYRRQRRR